VATTPIEDSDCALFAINPAAGIDQPTIDLWRSLDDFQTPRMVIVTGLEGMELDFEDAVLVANRVFDHCVTPYLVLHGDDGVPAALIRLEDLAIIDYSTQPSTIRDADSEHKELVEEFRSEYLEDMQEMGSDAFAAGIVFPAIPVVLQSGIGVDIVQSYIDSLPSRS
jgi:translation elongation factor EF-G